MATRSPSLMAALVTLTCVAWLAQSRDMPVGESRLALDGPTPGDVEAHAPGSVAAPASRARTAVAPEKSEDDAVPSGLVVRLRDVAGATLEGVAIRFAAVGTERLLAESLSRYERTDAAGEARLTAGSVEALFGGERAGRVAV